MASIMEICITDCFALNNSIRQPVIQHSHKSKSFDFSAMLIPLESLSFHLSSKNNQEKTTLYKVFLSFDFPLINVFFITGTILQIYPRHFCKIRFSPDKFRLFFFWQTLKYAIVPFFHQRSAFCNKIQLHIKPFLPQSLK